MVLASGGLETVAQSGIPQKMNKKDEKSNHIVEYLGGNFKLKRLRTVRPQKGQEIPVAQSNAPWPILILVAPARHMSSVSLSIKYKGHSENNMLRSLRIANQVRRSTPFQGFIRFPPRRQRQNGAKNHILSPSPTRIFLSPCFESDAGAQDFLTLRWFHWSVCLL